MSLLGGMLTNELEELERNNIVFQVVGRIEDLPRSVQKIVINAIEKTKRTREMYPSGRSCRII